MCDDARTNDSEETGAEFAVWGSRDVYLGEREERSIPKGIPVSIGLSGLIREADSVLSD